MNDSAYRSMSAAAIPARATELPTLTKPAPAVVVPVPVPVPVPDVPFVFAEPVPVVPPVAPPVPPGDVLEAAEAARLLKLAREREAFAAVLEDLLA